jgi:enolase
MPCLERLAGREILDSRGRPTVQATCVLASGSAGTASVPSGASTGTNEALELRDGDPKRYRGMGCRKAASLMSGEIAEALASREFPEQSALDTALIELDGTPNKSRLGANTMLAVSLAFARAVAAEQGVPLYAALGMQIGVRPVSLPRPTVNLFSGGRHAGGQVAVQDVLLVPLAARTLDEALATVYEVYQSAADLVWQRYAMRPLTADEGGLAPAFPNVDAMIEDALEAIRRAGFAPGSEVALALDVAASHFYRNGAYQLDGESLAGREMVRLLLAWLERYPIVSLEDGLAEEDWDHWVQLRRSAPGQVLILGDDLLCTHPARIRKAIEAKAADALLLKVNQIGTLTEAAEACKAARDAGWHVTVSARSGETEDDWLADLAVGWAADHIKIGSITQSERLAKYNRLLAIEAETGLPLAPQRDESAVSAPPSVPG